MNEVFRNEDGAIDLASIMVGIIIIGLIGGVIAATVFSVIPWSQDNAAKDQLSRVVQAEHAATALNGGAYTADVGNYIDLQKVGATVISNDPSCYGTFLKSASGNYFYASSTNSKPVQVPKPWPTTKPSNYPTACYWTSSGENVGQPMASYTNLFANPSFRNGTARSESNNSFTTVVDSSGDGTNLVSTRTSTNASRVGLITQLQSNTYYTVIMTLESTIDETLTLTFRPNTTSGTNSISLGDVTLVANQPRTVKLTAKTGSANYSTLGGVSIVSPTVTAEQVGSKLKVDNVAIIKNPSVDQPYPYNYFDGTTSGASWDGTPNDSSSTIVQ